jgi:hypothetical protein
MPVPVSVPVSMPMSIENTSHPFTLEIDHTTTPFTVILTYNDGVIIKMPMHKWAKEGYNRP